MLSVIIAVLILINSNLIPLYCRLTITGIKMEDVYCLHMIGIAGYQGATGRTLSPSPGATGAL